MNQTHPTLFETPTETERVKISKPVEIIVPESNLFNTKKEKIASVPVEIKMFNYQTRSYDTIWARLDTLKGKIIYILNKSEQACNDDDQLEQQLYYEFFGVSPSTTYQELKLFNVPTRDDIKRLRAKLNQQGYFLPTNPEVAKKRNLLEKWYHNYFAS